jgi:hypothetical protein
MFDTSNVATNLMTPQLPTVDDAMIGRDGTPTHGLAHGVSM